MSERMTVVHEPVVDDHVCGPGWVWHEHDPSKRDALGLPSPRSGYYWRDPYDVAVGTVVRCDCGQTWVCERDPGSVSRYAVWMPSNVWRRETRREVRKRERRERRAAR